MGDIIGVWLGALLTLCILSFLYKDNPFYKFGEALLAGISFGYEIGLTWHRVIISRVSNPLRSDFAGHWPILIPTILGILLYLRYVKKVSWISRWPLAIYISYYVGVAVTQKIHGDIIPQVYQTMINLRAGSPWGMLNNLIIIVGVISVLTYFYFSIEHRGPIKGISKVGIWFLMVSFGASFGYTVMGRISLLIGRMTFLVNDWIRGVVF